ncbi:MAG: VacJ family lipoprotein [Reinekea sp.]|jgi:phospholipid-binding lipoprotein MlaA
MGKSQPNRLILSAAVCLAALSVSVSAESNDPFESVNRAVFKVNSTADKWVIRPVAKAYQAVMPDFAERGVRNFFANLGEVRNTAHNLLQGKGGRALTSTGRFAINTTVGIGGLFDVATKLGMPQAHEDLGQTLGAWGMSPGPYLMLPILGPSSLRDSTGLIVDPFLKPQTYSPLRLEERLLLSATSTLQLRADLLSTESLLNGDTYTLIREAYLSRREFDVNDGRIIEDDFTSDEFSDDEFLEEEF